MILSNYIYKLSNFTRKKDRFVVITAHQPVNVIHKVLADTHEAPKFVLEIANTKAASRFQIWSWI